jgi:glycosyltransferase 2 family protein
MSSNVACPPPPAAAAHPHWARLRRWAVPVLGIVVLGLLLSHAHKVDWAGAWAALRRYPLVLLLMVLAVTTASHALYGCYDLLARRHVRHGLPRWRSWAIAVTSYAFNLNLGSWVGSIAARARLYARAGLDEAGVAQVVTFSVATNWLGYGLLAGTLFAAGAIAPPEGAHLSRGALRALGAAMVLAAIGYLVLCARAQGRSWCVRGRRLRLPSVRLALLQLGVSVGNWLLMGTAMYLLLGRQVPYGMTLGVLLAASIVGVLTPIPAGLGVLEAVYLALLSGRVAQGTLLGAVLAYRALYYLVPLAGGLALFAALERYACAHPPAAVDGAPASPR